MPANILPGATATAPVLRVYQDEAITAVRDALRARLNPLLVCPTGGGKTVLFSWVAAFVAHYGKRVLIVAHRRELLRQASAKLDSFGVRHGFLGNGYPEDADALVQVASIQTLANMVKRGDPRATGYYLIVPDEAHHTVSPAYRALFAANPGALILGPTATPARLDGRGLGRAAGGVFDTMVIGPSVRDLQARDHLVRARVFAPEGGGPDLRGVRKEMGDFARGQLSERMSGLKIVGDAVEHYTKHAPGRPAIAFCVSRAHAVVVAKSFVDAGYRAVAVDGATPVPERDAALGGLSTGAVHVVCCCDLISEGLDVPGVEAVILLRPTQSLCLHVQQIGRGLRPADGKHCLVVLDHAGNTATHGLPDEIHEWSLAGAVKRGTGNTVAVTQCQSCYAMRRPGGACPECGFEAPAEAKRARQLRVVDGQLVEIDDPMSVWRGYTGAMVQNNEEKRAAREATRAAREAERLARAQQKLDDEAARERARLERASAWKTYGSAKRAAQSARCRGDLTEIAEAFGYKQGWAYHVGNELFGSVAA